MSPSPESAPEQDHETTARGRRCPQCHADLTGLGVLTQCPKCNASFVQTEAHWTTNLALALRLIGPWMAVGGAFAIWRLPADARDPRETVNWFFIALLPLGVLLWCVGFWLGGRRSPPQG